MIRAWLYDLLGGSALREERQKIWDTAYAAGLAHACLQVDQHAGIIGRARANAIIVDITLPPLPLPPLNKSLPRA